MKTVRTTGNSSGQHRHAERNSGQHGIQPAATHDSVEQDRQHAHCAAENGEQADDAPRLRLQARRFGFEPGQRLTDLADLASWANGGHFRQSRASHHQRTRKYLRQVVAPRPLGSGLKAIVPRGLAHGYGFASQGRFVGLQILALQQHRVGRNPVSLGEDDEVTPHDVAAGDPLALAVANDERTGAGEIAQCLQNALGAHLLHHGDHDRHRGEDDQDDRLLQIAEHQINHATDEQQRQHRFAQHLDRYSKRCAPVGLREFVVTLGVQPRLSIRLTEAGKPVHRSEI